MSNEIPPLPELEISEYSGQYVSQEVVDHALRQLYDRQPELFKKIADREGPKMDPYDAVVSEFRRFLREELNLRDPMAQTSTFSEARRRSRIMFGIGDDRYRGTKL